MTLMLDGKRIALEGEGHMQIVVGLASAIRSSAPSTD